MKGQVTLTREKCEQLLANPDIDSGMRVIASCAMALFEVKDHAADADSRQLSIGRKLAHMIACEIYDALDGLETQS